MYRMIRFLGILGVSIWGNGAMAGTDTDMLSRCVFQNTTSVHKQHVVRWVWLNMAMHPSITELSIDGISPEMKQDAAQAVADIVLDILFHHCKAETKTALLNEGNQALEIAFRTLGETALADLIQNPHVIQAVLDTGRYLNLTKIIAITRE